MMVRWGISGTGRIAQDFATVLQYVPGAEVVAVGSRSVSTARDFGKQFGITAQYGSYEELATDKNVEVVYVSSLHPFHYEHAALYLRSGKAVLCEKPLALNARQVEELVDLAARFKVLFVEAMWTRHFPVVRELCKLVAEGALGDIKMVQGDFGFQDENTPRLQQLELGGGALLDIGVYPLSFASMLFQGQVPESIQASATMTAGGVDESMAMQLAFPGGGLASLYCTIAADTPKEFNVIGTKGRARVHAPFWCPTQMTLIIGPEGKEKVKLIEHPLPKLREEHQTVFTNAIGMYYEAVHVQDLLARNMIESDVISLRESVGIMKIMDEMRRQINLKYPLE